MSENIHIFLTGMMGSGKSSVGKQLAEILDCKFIDLDQEIENSSGKSIEAIFENEGEKVFRDLETQVANSLNLKDICVIATGGGFPLKEINRTWMKENGTIVWLKSSPAVILDRIKYEDRPLLSKPIKEDHISTILNSRIPIYEQADLIIETDACTTVEIAHKIKEKLL